MQKILDNQTQLGQKFLNPAINSNSLANVASYQVEQILVGKWENSKYQGTSEIPLTEKDLLNKKQFASTFQYGKASGTALMYIKS